MATIPMSPAGSDVAGTAQLMSPNEVRKSKTAAPTKQSSLVSVIRRLYDQAKRDRAKVDAKWQTCWDFYEGRQWPVKRAADKASPNCNIVASTINTITPIMTDTSPSFGIMGNEPKDMPFAELLTNVIKVWWDRRSMNHVLVEGLMDALVTDVGILKVVWDPDQDAGLGDIDVVVVDPKRLYVPKGASDFDRDCPWVIHEFFMSRGSLSLKFTDKVDKIQGAKAWSGTPEESASSDDTRVRVTSPVNKDIAAPDNWDGSGSSSGNDDIRVWECWMVDDSVIEEERINEDGEKTKILKKEYPKGRMVTLLPDCNEILQDVENPYKDGEHPFVRIIDMIKPRSFYGMGEVVGLSETQKMINKSFGVIMDWCNKMSNPSWVLDDDSGVDPDMLTSDVGQIIVKKKGTTVDRMGAPPIPSQLFEIYHTLMELADTQSGVHEVTQGRKPAGVTAGVAIETLQEAAQTRIRLKERNLLVSLNRLGRLIISRMLQFYDEPRVIRLTGRNDMVGDWPSYIRFYIEQGEDGQFRPVSQRIEYDEMVGDYVDGPAEEGIESVGEFELDVTSGTSLPFVKEQRSQQAIRLFEAQAIDQQALLDVLEFPEKDNIIQRMTESQAAAAEAMPPPGPEGAPPPGVM